MSHTMLQGLLFIANYLHLMLGLHTYQKLLKLFNPPFSVCPKISWCNTTDHLRHLQWHDLPQLGEMLRRSL